MASRRSLNSKKELIWGGVDKNKKSFCSTWIGNSSNCDLEIEICVFQFYCSRISTGVVFEM